MLRVEKRRNVRIDAPLDSVWNELSRLDTVLAYVRELQDYKIDADGCSGAVVVRPADVDVTGIVQIRKSPRSRHVEIRGEIRRLRATYLGQFKLSEGAALTTLVRYSARVECDHSDLRRSQQEAGDRLKRHVIDLIDRVKKYIEQDPVVRKARERALKPAGADGQGSGHDEPDDGRASDGRPRLLTTDAALSDPPWLAQAEERIRSRLRRLVEESDPDERRTAAWGTLDRLHRSLRYPV